MSRLLALIRALDRWMNADLYRRMDAIDQYAASVSVPRAMERQP